METIQDRMQARMTELGLNQVQLAKISGVGQGRITNILTGRTKDPQSNTSLKIARALRVDLNWLIGGEEWLLCVAEEQEKYGKKG